MYDLTVLGTSDTHGNVRNWDYYRDADHDDGAGVAKVATLVNRVRTERRGRATLVLDAGDTIEGTPLASHYALWEPITSTGDEHPMAKAMNVIGYDAVTLGNHEFDYGLPLLEAWIRQLRFPALAANAVDAGSGRPAFTPSSWGARCRRCGWASSGSPTRAPPSGTGSTSRASCGSSTWWSRRRSGCR